MIVRFVFVSFGCFIMSACAGIMPVPGGTETINQSFYESGGVMREKLLGLKEGMTKEDVLKNLGRTEEELTRLDRQEIVLALFGSSNNVIRDDNGDAQEFLKSLSGYKLNYKVVKRKHGIKNPVRVETDETGFSYSAILIFMDDLLYEQPILSGGPIDNTSSSTIFDYLNPGTVINRVE